MRFSIKIVLAATALTLGAHAASAVTPTATAGAANAATIQAYKRDPVPIYDETGSKTRDIPQKEMPQAKTPAAQVINTKTGFVAIMLDGKPAWLRLTSVDYVGDLPTPKCEKGAVQLAFNEEDGVERSLGLGCDKPKGK